MPTSRIWHSAGAFASRCGRNDDAGSRPILDHHRLPAPAHREQIGEDRAATSVGPPAANGTTSFTARNGKSAAVSPRRRPRARPRSQGQWRGRSVSSCKFACGALRRAVSFSRRERAIDMWMTIVPCPRDPFSKKKAPAEAGARGRQQTRKSQPIRGSGQSRAARGAAATLERFRTHRKWSRRPASTVPGVFLIEPSTMSRTRVPCRSA